MKRLNRLDVAPVNIRPPFDQRPPEVRPSTPGTDPRHEQWRARVKADRVAAITDALAGVELGTYDRTMIEWMAGWDTPTIGGWVSLILRARAAGGAITGNGEST